MSVTAPLHQEQIVGPLASARTSGPIEVRLISIPGIPGSVMVKGEPVAGAHVALGERLTMSRSDGTYSFLMDEVAVPDRLMAGAGSMVAALAVASGREPDSVIGKPEPGLFRQAAAAMGSDLGEAVVIGDGLGARTQRNFAP